MEPTGDFKYEKVEPNLKIHTFSTLITEKVIKFEVIKCMDSLYLWIGEKHNRTFDDLSLALSSHTTSQPLCTKIMGQATDLTSNNIAIKLSKKLGKPVYVSFNLVEDRLTVSVVNKRIAEEIQQHPECF